MMRNLRGCYMNFAHDRAQDWDFLAKWQPNVIRLMLHGSHTDPASVDVNRIRRVHETCPDALILLRVWDVDDRNFEAHEAMVADPHREADKQLDWWASVINRAHALSVPRQQLMAGLNNETGPEKDAALYVYTEWALKYATKHGIRVGALVFSVGRPSLAGESQYDMPYFEHLLPLFLAGDHAMLLHEYMQPEGMYAVWRDDQGNERKDYTYLIGRHKRWNMPGVKKIIAEWGIDGILYNRHPHPEFGNSGWRNFRDLWPPDRYADEYVECVRQADDSVIGICPFLSDFPDRKWASFDLLDAYPQFIARKDLCVKDVEASTTPPITTHMPSVSSEGPTPPAKPAYVSVPAGANVRVSPVYGDVLTAAPYGAQVDVLGIDDSGDAPWARVRYAGVSGWTLASLLSAEPPVPQPTPAPSESVASGIIEPRVAQAILRIESGGRTHGENGKPLIRFEAHVFRAKATDKAHVDQFFRFDANTPWLSQEWRSHPDKPWTKLHTGSQGDEYAAFALAQMIDHDAAYQAISVGAGQILGTNHARIGYPSAEAMFNAFQSAPMQMVGFINFFLSDPALVDAMRRKDWREIAKRYNGAGAVDTYAPLLERAYRELGGN